MPPQKSSGAKPSAASAAVERAVRSAAFGWTLVALPAALVAGRMAFGPAHANPVEFLLLETGEWSARLLILTLWLTPARLLFPGWPAARAAQRHRRLFGVSAFAYALAHFGVFCLDQFDLAEFLENATKPFALTGLAALATLAALAATSANSAVKRLGARRWKRLHRAAYLAAGLALAHMALKEKAPPERLIYYWGPLLAVQAWRLGRWWRARAATAAR